MACGPFITPCFPPMNPHSATLLRALATLRVTEIRFTITRDGDTEHHSIPRARTDDIRVAAQPFSILSLEDLFEAYAVTPRKGTYTLRVIDGRLDYEPMPPRKLARRATALGRSRPNPAFASRPDKVAA